MQHAQLTTVVGYVRVSTEQQAGEGVSLDAQKAKLHAYALAMDLHLVDVFEDRGLSAKSLARPGLHAALAALEGGSASGLLVTKLDRLTRSVRDLGDLVDRFFASRFSLLSLSDAIDTRTASGRLVLHVLGAVSQWEREATAERTRDALAQLRADGVALGADPFGWRRTEAVGQAGYRNREVVSGEMQVVARVLELQAAGVTVRAIATTLSVEGRSTKRGARWHPTTVQRISTATRPIMTREAADALWGADAVNHALRFEDPERITKELNDEVARRHHALPRGAFPRVDSHPALASLLLHRLDPFRRPPRAPRLRRLPKVTPRRR